MLGAFTAGPFRHLSGFALLLRCQKPAFAEKQAARASHRIRPSRLHGTLAPCRAQLTAAGALRTSMQRGCSTIKQSSRNIVSCPHRQAEHQGGNDCSAAARGGKQLSTITPSVPILPV